MDDLYKAKEYVESAKPAKVVTVCVDGKYYRLDYNFNPPKMEERKENG